VRNSTEREHITARTRRTRGSLNLLLQIRALLRDLGAVAVQVVCFVFLVVLCTPLNDGCAEEQNMPNTSVDLLRAKVAALEQEAAGLEEQNQGSGRC